ncbi:hypothetical protein ACTFIR_011511 [Dictyostelium discoideum]
MNVVSQLLWNTFNNIYFYICILPGIKTLYINLCPLIVRDYYIFINGDVAHMVEQISSYSFESDLNTLQLIIQCQVENDCPTNSINRDNNLDNFKIKLNDRSLNSINIPHYENLIQMDPSFSILNDHTSSTNEKSRDWIKTTIGVVVGVVDSTILIIVGFIKEIKQILKLV